MKARRQKFTRVGMLNSLTWGKYARIFNGFSGLISPPFIWRIGWRVDR